MENRAPTGLSALTIALHDSARAFAAVVFNHACVEGATEIRVHRPDNAEGNMQGIANWPAAANDGFDIALKFPDGKWFHLIQPGAMFRHALIHYMLAEYGIDVEQSPIAGTISVTTPSGQVRWNVTAESLEDVIAFTRIVT